ncbi:hypothetical protein VTJ49DRAFT_4022 [Mycothermus thermophilus]|uniref:RNA polymerase II elongator complex subunit n=1 Tax=Humicola insolens TaxID=85995 RepID=A0ABR3VM44_HUMIN
MPVCTLIIVTGLPTSGKTTRARQLYAYLESRIGSSSSSVSPDSLSNSPPPQQAEPQQQSQPPSQPTSPPSTPQLQTKTTTSPHYRLHYISDTTLSISRTVYDLSPENLPAHVRSANALEKDARAAVYAAVKRVLSPRDIVVLDGLNYIKGWRYQLFCEAKNARTASCVLQVGCSVDRARGVNEGRLKRQEEKRAKKEKATEDAASSAEAEAADGKPADDDPEQEPYTPSNWENLVFRYEEPNAMTRWDSPLFTLVWDDDEAQTRQVFAQIWDAVAGEGAAKRVIRPNQSTVQRDKDPGGDYLYVLERETQDIVKQILARQPEDGGGGEVRVPRAGSGGSSSGRAGQDEEELVVHLPGKKVGLPQLQRYRRAFVGLNRGGIGLEAVGKLAAERLRESFVGYLNDAFEKDG